MDNETMVRNCLLVSVVISGMIADSLNCTGVVLARNETVEASAQTPQSSSLHPELVLPIGASRPVIAVSFSRGEQMLLSGNDNNAVNSWDVGSGHLTGTLTDRRSLLRSMTFSPNGKIAASTDSSGHVIVTSLSPASRIRFNFRNPARIRAGSTVADVKGCAMTCHEASTSREVQIPRPIIIPPKIHDRVFVGHKGATLCAAFSADEILATGGADRSIKLWNVAQGKLAKTLTGHRDQVVSVSFSNDRRKLASGSRDGMVKLWNAANGAVFKTLKAHQGPVLSVAFSPDGNLISTAGSDMDVKLWNVATGHLLHTLTGHRGSVLSMAFSHDRTTLATGSSDESIMLWDVRTGRLVHTLKGHQAAVLSLAFSADSSRLASGSADTTLRLWDPRAGRNLVTLTTLPMAQVTKVVLRVEYRKFGTAEWVPAHVGTWLNDGDELRTVRRSKAEVSFSDRSNIRLDQLGAITIQPGEPNYVVFTTQGYYIGSPGAAQFIKWRVGNDMFPVEAFERDLHRPDLVRKVLTGEIVTSSPEVGRFLAGRAIPPHVSFVTPRDGQEVSGTQLTIVATATDDTDIQRMELFVNGRPVRDGPSTSGAKPIVIGARPIPGSADRAPDSHRLYCSFQWRVMLPPGERELRLKAVAYDDESLQGWDEVRLLRTDVAAAIGDLFVLSAGVSRYRNSRLNLQYAARDADAFADLWKNAGLPLYREVRIVRLIDEKVTTHNVMTELRKFIDALTNRDGRDTVMLFLSGHGLRQVIGNREVYYFASHDVDQENLDGTSLRWSEIQDAVGKMNAKRVVVFLDACHSGSLLGTQQADSDRLVELLRRSAVVFASCRGPEYSYELDKFKHGAFTLALIEGIRDGKADMGRRDASITPAELLTWLQERVPELTHDLQTPICPLLGAYGEPFQLARVSR